MILSPRRFVSFLFFFIYIYIYIYIYHARQANDENQINVTVPVNGERERAAKLGQSAYRLGQILKIRPTRNVLMALGRKMESISTAVGTRTDF